MTAVITPVPKLLTDTQAAEFLNVKRQTLAAWRCTGRHGLRYVKVGRSVRYRREDLERWLNERTVGGEGHAEEGK